MNLPGLAQQVLTVASTALPDVDRVHLAGGPQFARTCTLLAVYADPLSAVSPPGVPSVHGSCGAYLTPRVVLVYAKDCYPMPREQGQTVDLPSEASLSAWTAAYLSDVNTLMNALLDAAIAGDIGDGDCSGVTVGPTVPTGPSAGVCTTQFPVTLNPLA